MLVLDTLREFLLLNGQSCMDDFVKHFNSLPGEILPLLDEGLSEKLLKKQVVSSCCNSGCVECHSEVYKYYEWVGL